MDAHLIYDTLIPQGWQKEKYVQIKLPDPGELIQLYPQLSESEIHDITALKRIPHDSNSKVYKYDSTILKYMIDTIHTPEDTEAFYREIIIGLELNKLNLKSFMRTAGYYVSTKGCAIPKLNLRDDTVCIYLYLHEIRGPSLTKFLHTATLSQFQEIMTKLLADYKIAREHLDFCHYDLHPSNIIISKEGDALVPVIIDFGSSHINLPSGHIGEYWPSQGRYNNTALWVYDMFKIFAYCWQETVYSSNKMWIERYFHKSMDDFMKAIDSIQYCTIPATKYRTMWTDESGLHTERPMDFLERLERENVQWTDEGRSLKDIRNISIEAARWRDIEMLELDKHAADLAQINEYCLKVLKFFRDEITPTWLEGYCTDVTHYWSSSVTQKGSSMPFDEFMEYISDI